MKIIISQQEEIIQKQRDSIRLLSVPAKDRYANAWSLYNNKKYHDAYREVNDLISYFPYTEEGRKAKELKTHVQKALDEQEKKDARMKAQGFVSIPKSNSAIIGDLSVSFSDIKVGRTYHCDAYEGHSQAYTCFPYQKVVSAKMTVSSKSEEKYPRLPCLALYKIDGDKMVLEETASAHFLKWGSKWAFIGSKGGRDYEDPTHDFSKYPTISFLETITVNEEVVNEPYAIVLHRRVGRILGERSLNAYGPFIDCRYTLTYKKVLTIDDFLSHGEYQILTIKNL